MRKLTGLVMAACLAFVFVAGCAKPVTETGQKTCPVMGGPIDPRMFTEHEGRRIYFCCAACIEKFKADPEKYVAKVDAELKGAAAPAAAPATPPAAEPAEAK